MISLAELLKNFAADLNLDFTEDPSGSYSYQINDAFLIQIEMAKNEHEIVIGSFFTTLPPGKFRENVLTNTLKANYVLEEPSFFAFSIDKDELLLYQTVEIATLNSQKLKEHLTLFTEKALLWKEALEGGQAAPAEVLRKTRKLKR